MVIASCLFSSSSISIDLILLFWITRSTSYIEMRLGLPMLLLFVLIHVHSVGCRLSRFPVSNLYGSLYRIFVRWVRSKSIFELHECKVLLASIPFSSWWKTDYEGPIKFRNCKSEDSSYLTAVKAVRLLTCIFVFVRIIFSSIMWKVSVSAVLNLIAPALCQFRYFYVPYSFWCFCNVCPWNSKCH